MKKLLILLSLFTIVMLSGCTDNSNVIKIGHKNYTEQRITGNLLSVYLESKGYETDVVELAGTMLNYNALINGNIDIYPEFTGTAYISIYGQSEILTPAETYAFVKEYALEQDDLVWLDPLGWNNTYVLSVTQELADLYNLVTISDLAEISATLTIGSDSEFINRNDGLVGLREVYGLEFASELSMDQGLTYAALANGDIDVNSSYSTDGRIAKFGFVNLIDDKNFFPPYFVTPVVRSEFAENNQAVIDALIELGGQWSDEELQVYNLMVDEGADAREVATLMLRDKGFID